MYLKALREENNKLYSIGSLPKWLRREYIPYEPVLIEDNLFPLYCYLVHNNLDVFVHSFKGYQLWKAEIVPHESGYIIYRWSDLFRAKSYDDLYKIKDKRVLIERIGLEPGATLCDSITITERLF